MKLEFEIYSKDTMPTEKKAGEISCLFCTNYPDMYSDDTREYDISRYDSFEKIQQQIKDGNFYITASLNGEAIGMTKFRKEAHNWLGSWIMVKKEYRNKGIGEQLFYKSYEALQERAPKDIKTYLVLDIHKENIPSIVLFERMGFEREEGKTEEFWKFKKEIVSN